MKPIECASDIEAWEEGTALYELWNAKRHDLGYPSWADFSIADLTSILPHMLYIELGHQDGEEAEEAYVRFIGSGISAVMSSDTTGQRVLDGAAGQHYSDRFKMAIRLGLAYSVAGRAAAFAGKNYRHYDAVVLPLSRNRDSICSAIMALIRWVK